LQVIDWQVVIDEHGQMVWQTAYRLLGNHEDAADCFQETFAGALLISRAQPVRNFPALLTRLATSRAIDRLRQRCRQSGRNNDCGDPENIAVAPAEAGPAATVEAQDLVCQLRGALARLPPLEAQAFCLRYMSDMSYHQIAKELGIRTSSAGVLLYRAKGRLRRHLQAAETEKDEVVR
jgi:RNA polymerase sigma-70 factor (ECF subfamily)